jgi:hypothetical protein
MLQLPVARQGKPRGSYMDSLAEQVSSVLRWNPK